MPGAEEVLDATNKPFDAAKLAAKADLIFCLDFSGLDRLESFRQDVEESPAHKIVVDHHIDPEPFGRLYFHRTSASSTAELIYRLIVDLGFGAQIDAAIAQCLYTGIMTDTGSFRFPSTTAEVHFIVGNLLKTGIDVGEIHRLVYDNFSENRLRFMGYVLNQKMVVLPEYHTAYMVLTLEEQERFSIKPGDDEGLVNYNLSMKGIHFAALIKEGNDRIRMSFRSQGDFPCNEFAGNFGGGGHKNAAGGKSEESLEQTIVRFMELLETYKDQLANSVKA
jgi:phosphoesterase RecJ-like protein